MKLTKKELYKKVCDEIKDEELPTRVEKRNGLKKYLGVKVAYTATFKHNHLEANSCLVLDVRVKGKQKVICDHLWLGSQYHYKHGTTIEFSGIATSYIDANGERKYKVGNLTQIKEIK